MKHSGVNPQIPGRVLIVEELVSQDPDVYEELGYGFLLFVESVAFVDEPTSDKSSRGRIVTDPGRLEQYESLYKKLYGYSRPVGGSQPESGAPGYRRVVED